MFSLKISSLPNSNIMIFWTKILAHGFTSFDFRKCFKERFSQCFQSGCKVWSGLIICRSSGQRCAISGRAWWIRGFQTTPHSVGYDYLLSYASRWGKQHKIFSTQLKLLKRGYKSEKWIQSVKVFFSIDITLWKLFNHKPVFSLSLWNLIFIFILTLNTLGNDFYIVQWGSQVSL